MSKRVLATTLIFVGLLAIGVSACQSQTTEVAQVPATATPLPATPTTEKVATATTEPAKTPTAVPTITPAAPSGDDPTPTPAPTSAQEKPAPTPTLAWQIPQEREDDWKKGGDNAGLVIVEYGDYQ